MANAVRATLVCAGPPIPDQRVEPPHEFGEDGVDVVQAGQQVDDVGARVRVLLAQHGHHKDAQSL
jgi:hypothetical protein